MPSCLLFLFVITKPVRHILVIVCISFMNISGGDIFLSAGNGSPFIANTINFPKYIPTVSLIFQTLQ